MNFADVTREWFQDLVGGNSTAQFRGARVCLSSAHLSTGRHELEIVFLSSLGASSLVIPATAAAVMCTMILMIRV
jgi:hypothetical protein